MKRFVLLLFASYSCDFYDGRLIVVNESGKSICVETINNEYPGVSKFNQVQYYLEGSIPSGTERKLIETGTNGWEESIRENRNGKLNLVVFPLDTLQKYKDLGYLFDHGLYTYYSYTLKELNNLEWKIKVKN
jgi:hypothetical protein